MANGFIEKVAEQISDKHSRKLITAELESHLLDKIDYYVDIGYPREEAEKRATDEMGDPDDTAVPLNFLHTNIFLSPFTIICACLVTAMFLCTVFLKDKFIYRYDTVFYRHDVLLDFISLAFIITYVVLLILSRKKNNYVIPIIILISFILQFVSIFFENDNYEICSAGHPNLLYFYQPAVFAVVKTVTEGFSAYMQCIFTKVPAQYSGFAVFCFEILPYIIGAIFILWSILLLIKICRREMLLSNKGLQIPIGFFEICMCIFLSVNLVYMTATTTYKAVEDCKTDNNYSANKQEMVDYVLTSDLSKDKSEVFSDLASQGYYQKSEMLYSEAVYYDKGGELSLICGKNDDFSICLQYNSEDYLNSYDEHFNFDTLNKNSIYNESPKILADLDAIQKISKGTTLESIKKSGLLKYTDYVSKTFYEDKKETEIELCLTIYLNNGTGYLEESDNRNYKILTIKDGVVVDCYSD